MDARESKIIEFLYGTDDYLFKKVDETTNSELETFVMACWRCFMTNTQWLLLFYKNDGLIPYWQIAFTIRLLIETVADLKYVLNNPEKAASALNAYKNFSSLTDEDFKKELRKLRGSKEEKGASLLSCNIGQRSITRIKDILGDEYADTYLLLCDFSHCNYCGIVIASSPTKQLNDLRHGSSDIVFGLCGVMRDTLPLYEKFSELHEWLEALSKYTVLKNDKTRKERSNVR